MGKFSPCCRAYMFCFLSYILYVCILLYLFIYFLSVGCSTVRLHSFPRRAAGKTSRLPLGREDVSRQIWSFSDMSCLFFFFSLFLSPPYLRCSIPSSEGWRNVTQKKKEEEEAAMWRIYLPRYFFLFIFLYPFSISITA